MDVSVNSFGRRTDHHHHHQRRSQCNHDTNHRSQMKVRKSFLQSSNENITPSPSPSPSPSSSSSSSYSPRNSTDLVELDKRKCSSQSNLRQFIHHTTPRVPAQYLPMSTHLQGLSTRILGLVEEDEEASKYFFSLSDLWDSFDEWSAYGAGVPIVLNGQEDNVVTQYYVPYLSALQLYSSSAVELASKQRGRRLGDDSDGSELEYRDSNSETSSIDGGDHLERASCSSSDVAMESECLLFEYFESAAPPLRAPLYDKVKDLAMQFRGLKTLNSNELSQSSWFSVAWYPIYRIPTGATLKDLGACFLTYHSLSTVTDYTSGNRISSTTHGIGQVINLNSFGFAGYKFRGPVWTSAGPTDRHYAASLHRSTYEWLKRLFVCHPDFEYFMSHSSPASAPLISQKQGCR